MGEAKRRKDLGLHPREKDFVIPKCSTSIDVVLNLSASIFLVAYVRIKTFIDGCFIV